LSELGERFAGFRWQHPRGARVPKDLRAAALAALKNGATPGDLHRSCGISWSQVMAWKASEIGAPSVPETPKGASRRSRSPAADVRVFNVTEAPQPGLVGHDLELRLGPWSVSVRLAEAGHTGRG
jgi:hypothetical protein